MTRAELGRLLQESIRRDCPGSGGIPAAALPDSVSTRPATRQGADELPGKIRARRVAPRRSGRNAATPAIHLVDERDPLRFRIALADAVAADDGRPVFIADPSWGERERAQFAALAAQPSLPLVARASSPWTAPGVADVPPPCPAIMGKDAHATSRAGSPCHSGWLCIPTGGSSGNLKLARHDGQTLAAAVDGFCRHFGVGRVNAVGLLPLHHISGLMAWMRCALTGGVYRHANWKRIERGEERPAPGDNVAANAATFLSLVPTQLQRLLDNADESALAWLRGFRAVFIGGGPSWPALVEAGAAARLPLAFSYGMTETAAMVAALTPEEFAAGGRGAGRPMPHARIDLMADGGGGNRIAIRSASLFHGYWPGWRAVASATGVQSSGFGVQGAGFGAQGGRETGDVASSGNPEPETLNSELARSAPWETGDAGSFDTAGSLHVSGRRDALIITGGEKVNPQEVEAALRATGFFPDDVAVIGVPDPGWGEAVVACYPADDSFPPVDAAAVRAALTGKLAPFKYPRRYVAVTPWPRSAQGKLNREALRRHAAGEAA
ncbi:acyl-CoA synthetase (AMP-forming)/AMP-acid ligase II [Opitutaceae bacterium TAV1]|nr:acyl-CoA synthetase (AMP-forming)/AMP-acid ligase II [Opitutaceae bacterium TAV1]